MLLGLFFPIYKTGNYYKCAGCDNVHNDTVCTAGRAYSQALKHRCHYRKQYSGQRTEGKGSNKNRNVSRVIFQKGNCRENRESDKRNQYD